MICGSVLSMILRRNAYISAHFHAACLSSGDLLPYLEKRPYGKKLKVAERHIASTMLLLMCTAVFAMMVFYLTVCSIVQIVHITRYLRGAGMARKCDTAKYKKRRQREHLNGIERAKKAVIERRLMYERTAARREEARQIRIHDPRRLEIQKIVNILYAHISNDPVYKISQIAALFNVDIKNIGMPGFTVFNGMPVVWNPNER